MRHHKCRGILILRPTSNIKSDFVVNFENIQVQNSQIKLQNELDVGRHYWLTLKSISNL